MILSACQGIADTQTVCAGAHLFLTGGQARLDAQKACAAGQPFNAVRAIMLATPKELTPALHPFHAAGHYMADTQPDSAGGNPFNGRGHVPVDTHSASAASTFYAVRPRNNRPPEPLRRAASFHAVCGLLICDTQKRSAANSTPLRRRAVVTMQPDRDAPAATHTQGDNNV